MKKKSTDIWVGIFVVVGILLLIFMTLKIERFQFGKEKGYLVSVYFDTAAGLVKNASVRVAGVSVGMVEKISLDEGKAKVTFHLPNSIAIYRDAKAFLKAEGFLGEKYVEITLGSPGHPRVEPGGVIDQGTPPADMESFLSKMSDVGEDIKDAVKPVAEILKSVDRQKVEGMINNLERFSGQLGGIAADTKKTFQKGTEAFSRLEEIGAKVNRGEGTLGKLITDEAIYQEAKETVEAAKEAAETVKETAETLKNVSEKIEQGEGTLGKLIQDESLYIEAKETLQSMKGIAEKVEKGEGSLGKLIHDESLYTEAKETLQSVRGIAEKVEKGEGTLGKLISDDSLVKETEKTMKKVQKAAEGIQEQTPITVLGTIIGLFF
jgi:phospholipid/cholesterol/gamma-HCH transport system substrate-binding protein